MQPLISIRWCLARSLKKSASLRRFLAFMSSFIWSERGFHWNWIILHVFNFNAGCQVVLDCVIKREIAESLKPQKAKEDFLLLVDDLRASGEQECFELIASQDGPPHGDSHYWEALAIIVLLLLDVHVSHHGAEMAQLLDLRCYHLLYLIISRRLSSRLSIEPSASVWSFTLIALRHANRGKPWAFSPQRGAENHQAGVTLKSY